MENIASDMLINTGASEIRENLVTTAVKFLSNPNIQRCTMDSKERFLRSKGLTDLEIVKALEKCAVDMPSMTSELMFFHQSRTSWFREHVLPIIVYGGFAYGAYWFYKNCIRHLLFVEQPKRKTTAECLEELRKSIDVLNVSMTSLRTEVQNAQQPRDSAIRSQIETLKSDVASVKGILLNRNQFPTIKTRGSPPSIPAWQRQSEEATSTAAALEPPPPPHRGRSQRSESGGSNSSEGEHGAKHSDKNSDSSLEIIT